MRRMRLSSGFSLAELLVVVAIFLILTTVILINQNRFSSDTSITNLGYQVALAIRQAQVYGISVKGPANFDTAYGVHFDTTSEANRKKFVLFADTPPHNGKFDSNQDPVVREFAIENGIKIKGSGGLIIFQGNSTSSAQTADITFRRPNPEAIITADGGTEQRSKIQIVFESALGDRWSTVTVTQTGQIYVN
jgi:prepilin-type N-terminal cleavage/methylation domain-containing protein